MSSTRWTVAVCAALGIAIVAVSLPGYLKSIRQRNERRASAGLKTIATAEAEFRSNDRDGNHVNDFWTLDVAGLYAIDGTRLIQLDIALADLDPSPASALKSHRYDCSISEFGARAAKSSYRFGMLTEDRQVTKADGDGVYRQDTDSTGERAHNYSRFGAFAMPEGRWSGRSVWLINEGNTMFRRDPNAFDPTWPTDDEFPQEWSEPD
jgi:hypothetical protein